MINSKLFEMLSSFSSISFNGTLSNVKGSTIFSPIVSVSSRLKFWKTNPNSWRRKMANSLYEMCAVFPLITTSPEVGNQL